jgi:serine/threonine-protein kinase
MPKIIGSGKNVTVPNLIGKPLVEAQRDLINQNFTIGSVKQVYDTFYPYSYIVSQKPLPNSIVKIGKKINLMVSKGPQMVKVPFLEQMSLEQGLRMLVSLNIQQIKVESIRSSNIPSGKIIGTEPGAGSQIPIGRYFRVFVSNGTSGLFFMPMLVGLPTQNALDSIMMNGLIIGSIQEIISDEPGGTVIIQYPEDGMRVFTGDTVRLIVARKKY